MGARSVIAARWFGGQPRPSVSAPRSLVAPGPIGWITVPVFDVEWVREHAEFREWFYVTLLGRTIKGRQPEGAP